MESINPVESIKSTEPTEQTEPTKPTEPILLNKYENGKIYKLTSDKIDTIYIGSTYNTLEKRLKHHYDCYCGYLKGDFGCVTSYELLKIDDVKIVLIEHYPCNTEEELRYRERYWLENTPNSINKIKRVIVND